MRSSLGRKSNEESSTGVPKRAVIRGKRTRCPFCFTLLTFSKPKGTRGALPIRAIRAAPPCNSGAALPLPRLVPSGKMPTHSPFFSMRAARFKAVRSALPRLMGKAPTLEITMPKKPLPARNRESRAIRRTHPLRRTERNMMITSRYE